MSPSALVVLTTVATEDQASVLARELVSRQVAACVNVLPGVRSVYRWQGEVCEDGEILLLIKTVPAQYTRVEATIRELHDYDLPEIVALPIAGGEQGYLSWLAAAVTGGVTESQ